MKLVIKQKLLSWFGTYHVYDEQDNIIYTIKGELSWGHKLKIYDKDGTEIAMLEEEILHLLARFNMIVNNENVGQIIQKLKFVKPQYEVTQKQWIIKGNIWTTNFSVTDSSGAEIMIINRKLFKLHDTYTIDVHDSNNAIYALMIGLTLDIMEQKAAATT